MSYTKIVDYAAKDALITGNPAKAVKGTELGAEFDAIQTADALNQKVGGADVTVADGGTGRSTGTTAYALIATGTTATGAQQSLAAGATTELLVGGGASALPVWTAATGSGAPVRATSPTLVSPALGTPTALVGTNITGTAAGLSIGGNAATATNLSGTPTFFAPITNSLGANVTLTTSGIYYDGPSIAQGSTGKWFVSGTVSVVYSGNATIFQAKLWDGTTIIASAVGYADTSGGQVALALSGYIDTPAGNLRISVANNGFNGGLILYTSSGLGKDSTITAFRVG